MAVTRENNLSILEGYLGYEFSNRDLLVEALTHRSFVNEARDRRACDNERFEFFGDSVIGFIVSELLFRAFPGMKEGELSKFKASLVSEESLATLAREIGLGRHLYLGRGEEQSGGRDKNSLLADAYESLVAALYLDGGDGPARRRVVEDFTPLISRCAEGFRARDHKTELQELAQACYGEQPCYSVVDVSGPPHDRRFTVEVFVANERVGRGVGRSKKAAEQDAARQGTERLKARQPGSAP